MRHYWWRLIRYNRLPLLVGLVSIAAFLRHRYWGYALLSLLLITARLWWLVHQAWKKELYDTERLHD